MNVWLVLMISVSIVSTAAYGLNYLKADFETNHKVEAETLVPLPDSIQQNQVSQLIYNGYMY